VVNALTALEGTG